MTSARGNTTQIAPRTGKPEPMGWLKRQVDAVWVGHIKLDTYDVWDGVDPQGHRPGAFDCPCKPFVTTDVEARERIVRHIPLKEEAAE